MTRSGWLLLLCLTALPARGEDLLLPTDRPGRVSATRREAVACFDRGREALALGVWVRLEPGAAGAPDRLAWIVPVPSAPERVRIAGPGLFAELAGLVRTLEEEQVYRAPESAEDRLRRLGSEAVSAGPESESAFRCEWAACAGVEDLRAWLGRAGFAPDVPEALAWYAGRASHWVAVCVRAPEGAAALPVEGALPTLICSFATAVPTVPVKAAAAAEAFDLTVYWVTRSRPAYDNRRDRPLLSDLVLSLPPEPSGPELRAFLDGAAAGGGAARWRFLLRASRERVNGGRHRPAKWAADPTVEFE